MVAWQLHCFATSFCVFFVEENSLPLLKQQLPEREGFRDSWLDVTTHSETQTLFRTDSQSISLGVAEAGTLNLDLSVLKSQNPIFFLRIPFNTLWSYHNYKTPVGHIDTLKENVHFALSCWSKLTEYTYIKWKWENSTLDYHFNSLLKELNNFNSLLILILIIVLYFQVCIVWKLLQSKNIKNIWDHSWTLWLSLGFNLKLLITFSITLFTTIKVTKI